MHVHPRVPGSPLLRRHLATLLALVLAAGWTLGVMWAVVLLMRHT